MVFRIKNVNIRLLLFTSISLTVLGNGGAIYLSTYHILPQTSLLLPFLLGVGLFGGMINLLLVNHGVLICSFTKDYLEIGRTPVEWSKLKSYKIDDASSLFKTLTIKTIDGSTRRISHRKKFATQDGFDKLLLAFENKIFQLNQKGSNITYTPPIWDRPLGKVYGYLIILIMIVYTIAVLIKELSPGQYTMYLIFMGGAIPFLIKVFIKEKDKKLRRK